jgi:hypothetical protein
MEFEILVDEVLKELLKRLQLSQICDSHPDRNIERHENPSNAVTEQILKKEAGIEKHVNLSNGIFKERQSEDLGIKVVDLTNKRLVTETVLKGVSLERVQKLQISTGCILTPLALDYIRDRGVQIQRI